MGCPFISSCLCNGILLVIYTFFLPIHLLVRSLITVPFLLVCCLDYYNTATKFTVFVERSCLNTTKKILHCIIYLFFKEQMKDLDINITADKIVCRLLVKNIAVTALSV